MTAPRWPFSTTPALASTIELLSKADLIGNSRFPARNFRLEWQVKQSRVKSYSDIVKIANDTTNPFEALKRLNHFHNQYLDQSIHSGARMDKFDLTSMNCSEPFRLSVHLDEFGHSEEGLFLVRIEELDLIARNANVSKDVLRQIAGDVAINVRNGINDRSKQDALADILGQWQDLLDNRPIFAAYWDDAQSVLADPRPGWAEELRDRLGLLHCDPALRGPGMEIDVLVFRYPIRLIPRYNRSGPRLLLKPTVLDGALSEAFCTAPAGAGVGSTIDLAGRDDIPWQEVIHPPIEYKPEHVWAVDCIKTSPLESLGSSRALHLIKLCIRASPDFQELCHEIDGDLM
jgi:hypothetical protein